jgi:hypothetical protein
MRRCSVEPHTGAACLDGCAVVATPGGCKRERDARTWTTTFVEAAERLGLARVPDAIDGWVEVRIADPKTPGEEAARCGFDLRGDRFWTSQDPKRAAEGALYALQRRAEGPDQDQVLGPGGRVVGQTARRVIGTTASGGKIIR